MEIIRENPLKWHYKIGGKYYNITIDDELEHWLKKDRFQPEINEKGIVKLKGVLIEKILEYL
ncbi:MAG: hypothetical protein NTY61_02630, partial [Candidatus Parcubacteria bacterium]|nr:hypothetical protein [Candidatus Parcubacteria bacterium]